MKRYYFLLVILSVSLTKTFAAPTLTIGSKRFTESYVLAEIIAQIAESAGEANVIRRFGLGGTGITYKALEQGEIDLYPEYTGTLSEAIVRKEQIKTLSELKNYFSNKGLAISEELGFNNTYAIAMKPEFMNRWGLKTIEDLDKVEDKLRLGLSHEFMERSDGLRALEKFYQFKFEHVTPMEHNLVYDALEKEEIDASIVYSTDAKIETYGLNLLDDNLSFFPNYQAILLMQQNLKEKLPQTWKALEKLFFHQIDESTMRELNAQVEQEKKSFSEVAREFLGESLIGPSERESIPWVSLGRLSLEHLKLVGVSLMFSILVGLPLGIMATKHRLLAQFTLAGSGLLQTIPSLALLCFLIPLVGIGEKPAYIALFLYGLLPIVRNTYTGLEQINRALLESATVMGLSSWQQLAHIKLPLASASIMAGVKTSAVINVGTATLAAFIGAGGLGGLIVTGLALNDNTIILQGAIPAAVLAIVIHIFFEGVDQIIVPRGLKKFE